MNEAQREFELRKGYLYARFHGDFNAMNNIEHFRATLEECKSRGCDRALCDLSTEVGVISFLSRFHIGGEVASFWDNRIKIALLGRPDQIDKDQFGVTVARNRGVNVSIFTDQDRAVEWLMA